MTVRIFDFADGFTSANAPGEFGAIEIVANQAIGAGGTITLDSAVRQMLKVSGSGGPQTASITPFGTTPPSDGTLIILEGTDDTNTLEIVYNDASYGVVLKGDAILGKEDTITLIWDNSTLRYIDQARNE